MATAGIAAAIIFSIANPDVGLRRIGTIVPGNIVPAIVAMLAMDLKEAMAINLRRARHTKELTQEELADRAGLSARYLGSIERGAVSASVTVLGRLAQALRVDACELIRVPTRRKTAIFDK